MQRHIPLFNQSHIATDRKSQAVFFRYIFLYLAVVPRRSLALHDWILKSVGQNCVKRHVTGLTNTTSIHVQINTIWWGKSHKTHKLLPCMYSSVCGLIVCQL